ncbi:TolC family protein [Lutispora thermophila]|uniref:Outer membrane efflux protein n=1 Tax=Lutispora thermophila DSM 19022 TaxID=1122184 RepID=A0A1M6C0F0_9FIRM|nr:TolC family protein [Lutispora thermophila]SHI54383.1 hypothetical protein SAMN02745176_00624 [Lutispora thermophila DSM 19022]
MKRLICTLLCTILILGNGVAYAEPKFRYSFEEALEIAMKNTPEYGLQDKVIEKYSDAYDNLYKATPNRVIYLGSMKSFISKQVDPQIQLENTYSQYSSARLQKENIKRNVALNLRSTVIGISKAEMAYKEAELAKKNKQKELDLLEIRYENGLISKKDYNEQKKKINNEIKDALTQAQDAVDLAYRQLNTMLGREDEKDIEVKLNDTVIPLEKLDLEQIKKDMIKKNENLNNLYEQRRIADYKFGLIKQRYDKYEIDKFTDDMLLDMEDMYDDAKEEYELANQAYENALDRFNKSFDDMIEKIKDIYDDIEELKKDIAEEKEKMELNKLLYESGRMTKLEYDALGDKITLMENDLKELELDLNMKYAELLIYSDLDKVIKE